MKPTDRKYSEASVINRLNRWAHKWGRMDLTDEALMELDEITKPVSIQHRGAETAIAEHTKHSPNGLNPDGFVDVIGPDD